VTLPSENAAADLAEGGFAFLDETTSRAWLERSGSLADWQDLQASWDGMALDTYMADGGRYRRRRFAVFQANAAGIRREAHQPHYQTLDYNHLNGGVARWFEPVPDGLSEGASFQAILKACHFLFDSLRPNQTWHIETHQFRIEASPGEAGQPTPEGHHRDGVDFVLVLMIRRENIARGTTTIHAPDGAELGSFTLEHPFEAALVDDHRVFHGVTAVEPIDASLPAHRDVLVVTFRSVSV
jgi:hypothetical protein